MQKTDLVCEILVIGSGPGGSITACLLAEAGKDVLLVEEGANLQNASIESYSLDEMNMKYRNGGITPTFGKTNVSYVEACCVGGGSEINAGLYHRLPPDIIKKWQLKYQINDFEEKKLEPFYEACEKALSISCMPGEASPASLKLKEGANKLNWKVNEIPRWFKYTKRPDGSWKETRQSMTKTYIPRAIAAGCRLLSNTKVKKIKLKNRFGQYAEACSVNESKQTTQFNIRFQYVFVCGGAMKTPTLLRQSGIKKNVGNSLSMHPMVKVVALFNEQVNSETMGIPAHQVKEFAPYMTLGCSISTIPYLAIALIHNENLNHLLESWKNMAVYYVAITGIGKGSIRSLPFSNSHLARFPVTNQDLSVLGEGLERLCRLLLKAGAIKLFPSLQGYSPIKHIEDLDKLQKMLPQKKTNLSTIHLFGSCPMGEAKRQCAVDSYGKLHDYNNIYLNDSSILPSPPSVNPQGTIMALAQRNTMKFLESLC